MKLQPMGYNSGIDALPKLIQRLLLIEQSVLLCYLYAGFSIRIQFRNLSGWGGSPGSGTLWGIAIQEMQHLHMLRRLRRILGQTEGILDPEFPVEGVYPFPLELEPFTQQSAWKYAFIEAPVSERRALIERAASVGALRDLAQQASKWPELPSYYDRLREALEKVDSERFDAVRARWNARIERARNEGDVEHFKFFHDVAFETHQAFARGAFPLSWDPTNQPAFPSDPLERSRPDRLAQLMHWLTMLLIELSERCDPWSDDPDQQYSKDVEQLWFYARSRGLMRKLLMPYGQWLATRGYGYSFSPPDDPIATSLSEDLDGDRILVGRIARYAAEAARLIANMENVPPDLDAMELSWLTEAILMERVEQGRRARR